MTDELPPTTKTTIEILAGPDCPFRTNRVAQIAAVYQPILQKTCHQTLRECRGKYARIEDAEDLSGDELVKMLDCKSDYFTSYDPAKGRLRNWIKKRVRNRTIDFVRKYAGKEVSDDTLSDMKASIDNLINTEEVHSVFQIALTLTEAYYKKTGKHSSYEIFLASKSKRKSMPLAERRKKWTEWEERNARSDVWVYIRDKALPQACKHVGDNPEDMQELVQTVWARLKHKKTIHLPD